MSNIIIKTEHLSKVYHLYQKPSDRLRESLSITHKSYHNDHFALKDVSIEIKKGENVGIIGTNGSGKSTLLKLITGIVNPTSGTVSVNGKVSALLELGTGFNPEYSGMENIYLNGTMMGFSKKEMEQKAAQIIEFAEIGDFINQPVKTYSSGMFARLAFAVAVNVEPEILIVDEVLSVGDVRFQMKCMNKMKAMMEGGVTVLFVSHDIHAIRRFCSKAIWINKGEVQAIGNVNLIADRYLDFLKCGEMKEEPLEKQPDKEELTPFLPADGIAEIIDFTLLDGQGRAKNQFSYDEPVTVRLTYDVYDEAVEAPVIGIALRSINDDYVSGVNTLLDHVTVPWKYGRNTFALEYYEGIRALGGVYYFDAALFDKTATVPIQYIQKIKEFSITAEYPGEGRFIIPHFWKEREDHEPVSLQD